MGVEVKFCGLARAQDAAEAARLGARFVGVIFAGGPRHLTGAAAAEVLAAVPAAVRRVGVFADASAEVIVDTAREAGIDALQLHGGATARSIDTLRGRFAGEIWGVARVTDALPESFDDLAAAADAVVLDARVDGGLGGSGVSFDWTAIARALEGRRPRRLVLAGGLTPENVADALATLGPDVVDVSSGVESSPGVKDHARMRAFADAVAGRGRAHDGRRE